jgi:hypothetical protein
LGPHESVQNHKIAKKTHPPSPRFLTRSPLAAHCDSTSAVSFSRKPKIELDSLKSSVGEGQDYTYLDCNSRNQPQRIDTGLDIESLRLSSLTSHCDPLRPPPPSPQSRRLASFSVVAENKPVTNTITRNLDLTAPAIVAPPTGPRQLGNFTTEATPTTTTTVVSQSGARSSPDTDTAVGDAFKGSSVAPARAVDVVEGEFCYFPIIFSVCLRC